MDIMGHGFLARNLRPIAHRHPDTVVLAAGVSWASGTSEADFAREADLVRQTVRRCVRTGRRLVFFSTAATGMYGAVDGPGREDSEITPCTSYGAHKYRLEEELRASGADSLILRLGHLVGRDQPPHQLIPALIRQVRQGRVLIHRGSARDLILVDDVVTIIDSLLGNGVHGETVNVASGTAVPTDRIVDHLEHRLGVRAQRAYEDVGTHHHIAIDKLRRLVPEVNRMGFGPGYYRTVLEATVPPRVNSAGQ
ncbi:NAD(P)-dependent oxidoreductase [Streptomyces sp. ST2-7A]|uniref:NAD-dependent epimerase/dehydratase family protein n=1 Tax=Streptomyces sp. ST2-7A TaxID=2907214 RepID=UPI001F1EB041|nr:NAD-dependent epimerase/dehydratase family protein [Streptomyces sp. ST2-7A]MCE7082456.1 NAD-dependent epimerase/dehydratase family protein [Streptomyces sp. ST2-7A]